MLTSIAVVISSDTISLVLSCIQPTNFIPSAGAFAVIVIVFTYFVRMLAFDGEDKAAMTYRYALGKKVPEEMEITLTEILDEISGQVFEARL